MLTVHHLNNSRSQRVLWLLEELGLDYQVRHYQRDPVTMLAPASLRQIHPLGKAPVLTDGERVLAETGAIMEYLLDVYGQDRLRPATGTPERLRFTYWLHFAEGSAMPPLLLSLIFSKVESGAPWLVRPIASAIARQVRARLIQPNLKAQLAYMEQELTEKPWFAGTEFSAADVMMSFPLEAAQARGMLSGEHPHLLQWLERIHARPAYQAALAKGGPYELLR